MSTIYTWILDKISNLFKIMTDFFKPTEINDNMIPSLGGQNQNDTDNTTMHSIEEYGYTPSSIIDSPMPQVNVASDIIATSLDTTSRLILGSFTFGQVGAIAIGKYQPGASGDIRISPNGIVGRNSAGAITFSIDGTTGNAVFAGTLSAGVIVASGALTVGTNVGLGTAQDSAGVTTIVGNVVTTGYVNALNVTANSVNANWVYAGTINASQINAGTINGITITGSTITGSNVYIRNGQAALQFYESGNSLRGIIYGATLSGYDGLVIGGETNVIIAPDGGKCLITSELKIGGDLHVVGTKVYVNDTNNQKYMELKRSFITDQGNPGFGNAERFIMESGAELWTKDNWRYAFGDNHIYASNNGGNFNQIL